MYLTIRGLVLRVTNYNDTDALLTVLTHSHGKLTLKARGLRRKNSPLTAACQILTYAEFTLFEYRDMYTINEAHLVQMFRELRKDLVKLTLGTYFAQVSEVLCQEDQPNPELLSLVLNSLFAISKLNVDPALAKAVFELRSSCIAGYTPDVFSCHRCGSQYPDRFDVSSGHVECSGCRDYGSDGIRAPLLPGALEAMRYIVSCDGKDLFKFQIGQDSLENLGQVCELYISTQLERGFSTLDFYKTLFVHE